MLIIGGGAATTGILSAAFAVGAVLAGLFSGGWSGSAAQGRVIAVAIRLRPRRRRLRPRAGARRADPPDAVLVGALVAALVFLALAGAADAVSSVFRQTILQSATPDSMRGRLQGVFIVVVAGGPRLGDLVLGAEADWFGEALGRGRSAASPASRAAGRRAVQRRFLAYDARDPQP